MSTGKKEQTRLVTPKFRVSFPNVFESKAAFEGQEPSFSLQMIFPKKFEKKEDQELFDKMRMAMQKALVDKFGADKTKWPKNLRNPVRDGAEKEGTDGYGADVVFINAKSKMKPGIVDHNRVPITDPDKFYAGCYARATLTAYAYNHMGNAGVAFGLQNLQFMGHGEPFSGRKRAEDDFGSVEGVEDIAQDLTSAFGTEDLNSDF